NVAPPRSIMGGSARSLASLLVPVRCWHAPVTPDPPPAAPTPPVHTAWLPRSCSSSDMAVAFMQYGSGTGGATGAEAGSGAHAPLPGASKLSGTGSGQLPRHRR